MRQIQKNFGPGRHLEGAMKNGDYEKIEKVCKYQEDANIAFILH